MWLKQMSIHKVTGIVPQDFIKEIIYKESVKCENK